MPTDEHPMPPDLDPGEREPSPWRLLAPLTDLVTPMAVRVAATLRLADHIAQGAERVDELAERTATNPDALGRLLRHLACHGLFAQPSPGRFTLNEISALLRSDHPAGVRLWFDLGGFGGRMDLAFTELMHTVRTGQPAWEAAFGAPFWDWLEANPAMAASFDQVMAGSLRATAATGYDWSGTRSVVDVGGGTGSLLAEILQANPGIRGTLLDLPDTVARGREFLAERGLDGRDDPAMFAEMDLRMLVLSGGRERSVEDYGALARAAGLAPADVRAASSGHVIIDCWAA